MRTIADKTEVVFPVEDLVVTRKSAATKYHIIINVVASVIIMCCAGSVYAWSIFVGPLKAEYGLSTAQTQLIFGCIIGVFSITMLFVSRIERKIGPKYSAAIGAALFSAGYLLASFSGGNVVILLFGIGILSGAGMGFGYVTVLTTLVKWFPGHKGLATGIAVAGFGSGAILLSQIAQPILNNGITVTEVFRFIGIIYGVIFLAGALTISAPVHERLTQVERPVSIKVLSRDKRFWVLFYTFFAGSFAGLMLIGNLKPLGLNYGISSQATLLAIVLLSMGNAAGRILWGQIYDIIGGKRAVGIALALVSFFILMLLMGIISDIIFLVLCVLFGICYGANFVLYASDVSHIYGIEQLGIIYPVVSIAYGVSGIIGPFIGGYIFDTTQSYFAPIVLSAVICLSGLAVYIIFMGRSPHLNR
jgi:OFA family oxalate/formate antiporter-like MFS transporter